MSTEFIDRLDILEEEALMKSLGYRPYFTEFRRGSEKYYSDGYKVFHTWDYDCSSHLDYDDYSISVSDYNVQDNHKQASFGSVKILFSFMYNKFGDEWANSAINYLKDNDAEKSIEYIQSLVNNAKKENDNQFQE